MSLFASPRRFAAAIVLLAAAFAVAFGCTSPNRPYGMGGGTQGTGGGSPGTSAEGAICGGNADCKSGFCVDGVCCNAACDSPCHACASKLTGAADGDCSPVLGGSDPHADCPDDGAASCGRSGACDSKGACAFYPQGTECAPQSCTGSTKTLAKTCDGQGTCQDNGTASCGAKLCMGNVCAGDCSGDSSCAAGKYCDLGSGMCVDKLADGAACQAAKANECQSGFCASGVCCHQACTGQCEACTKALTGAADGTCAPAPAGTDPNGDCADQGAASCGTDGFCDGAGACRKYANGTVCAAGSCTGSTAKNPSTCSGTGTCVDNGSTSCAPFTCAGNVCASNCTSDGQCGSGKWCDNGACVAKLGNGAACSAASQCSSTYCVDGVCCDSPCGGQCQACSVATKGTGSNGTCGPIAAGADPDNECTDQGSSSCGTDGTCNGSGGCRFYISGTPCGSGSCAGGLQMGSSTCNGSGGCVPGSASPCAPYVCGATVCKTSCSSTADCISGYICSGTTCTMPLPQGSPCTTAAQCATGFCAQGYCCNSACTGTCKSCDGAQTDSGVDGTCDNISCPLKGGCGGSSHCQNGICTTQACL